MSKIDILILGSGIAACTAAALIAQKGLHVCVLSPTAATKHHLPESWLVNFPPYIANFGITDALGATFSAQNQCVFCSHDGSYEIKIKTSFLSEKLHEGDLASVNRDAFDQVLFENALALGAQFIKFDRIINIHLTDEGVQVDIEINGSIKTLQAPYIIDGSGKSAVLSKHLQLSYEETLLDNRLAGFSHFISNSEHQLKEMHIVAIPNGYIFCIPTFSERISIGYVVEETASTTNVEQLFNDSIAQSSFIASIVANSKQVLPFIPIRNIQKVCLKPCDQHYCLIGDAAVFMDPFFCPGIDFAFSSAFHAVAAYENQDPALYRQYVYEWVQHSKTNIYEKIGNSDWKAIMRLFSDPHQPFVIPLFLTQAFGQVAKTHLSLEEGIKLARKTYAA